MLWARKMPEILQTRLCSGVQIPEEKSSKKEKRDKRENRRGEDGQRGTVMRFQSHVNHTGSLQDKRKRERERERKPQHETELKIEIQR